MSDTRVAKAQSCASRSGMRHIVERSVSTTAAKAAVPLPITAMPTSAGAAFNRSFAKSGIGGMLFGPNGPEHEAHLLPARVANRFSLPHTTVTATAQQTFDATTPPRGVRMLLSFS
jgi:hypothetical protein